jgi:dienelactone hydrolase
LIKLDKTIGAVFVTALLFAFFVGTAVYAEEVGYLTLAVPVDNHDTVPCAVWYPATDKGEPVVYDFGTFEESGRASFHAPPAVSASPAPLVIYSHGYSGCGISAYYLCEELAAAGFVMAAPDHTDDLTGCSSVGTIHREPLFGMKLIKNAYRLGRDLSRGEYDPMDFQYRYREISRTIDAVIRSSEDPASILFGMVDKGRIGAVGHSLGAFSVMSVAGALAVAKDERIGPIASLSGPGGSVFSPDELGRIEAPTMLMVGEEEKARKDPKDLVFQFEHLTPPAFLYSIAGTNHLTFSVDVIDHAQGEKKQNEERERQALIARYVRSFFELFLQNEEGAREFLETNEVGIDYFFFSSD